MDKRSEGKLVSGDSRTTVERTSDRELVVTRVLNGPARIVFEAWTKPELLKRWWAPKSMGAILRSCEVDVRVGGRYRFEFGLDASDATMAFFGRYLEVEPNSRLVWTNEESEDGAVSTVTFEERGNTTLLTLRELYPSKEALDNAVSGMEVGVPQFEQLDELLVELGG